jgi:hypothetical protein
MFCCSVNADLISIKHMRLCDVTSCNLVEVYRHWPVTYCIYLQCRWVRQEGHKQAEIFRNFFTFLEVYYSRLHIPKTGVHCWAQSLPQLLLPTAIYVESGHSVLLQSPTWYWYLIPKFFVMFHAFGNHGAVRDIRVPFLSCCQYFIIFLSNKMTYQLTSN